MFDRYEFVAWLLFKFPVIKQEDQNDIFRLIDAYCAKKEVIADRQQEKNKGDHLEKKLISEEIDKPIKGSDLKEIVVNNAKFLEKNREDEKNKIREWLVNKFIEIKFSRKEKTLKNITMFYMFKEQNRYKEGIKKFPEELHDEVKRFFSELVTLPEIMSINFISLFNIVKFTLKSCSDNSSVYVKDYRERTFLHLTARVGYLDGFKKCLEIFPSEVLNSIDKTGKTPLEYMVTSKSVEMVQFFFPTGIIEAHIPLLFYAIQTGVMEIVPLLLRTELRKELLLDKDGNNLLHAALLSEKIEMLKIVIDFDKGLVNKPNREKKSPLTIASEMTHVVYDTKISEADKNRTLKILAEMIDIMIANGGVIKFQAAIRFEENFQAGEMNISSLPHLKRKAQQTKRRKFYLTFLFVLGIGSATLGVLLFLVGIVRIYLNAPAGIAISFGIISAVLAVLDARDVIRLDELFFKMLKASVAWTNRLFSTFNPRSTLENDIEMGILQQTEEAEKLLSKDDTYQTLLLLNNGNDQSVKAEVQISAAHQAVFKYLNEFNLALMQNVNSKSAEISNKIKIFIDLTSTQMEKLNNSESVLIVGHTMFTAFDNYLNRLSPKVTPEVDEFKQFLLATKKDLQKLIEKNFPNENQTNLDKQLLSFEDSVNDEDDSSLSMNR